MVTGEYPTPEERQQAESKLADRAGAAAWDAYKEAVGGRAYNGDALPDWATMKNDPQKAHLAQAWILAAQAARAVL